MSRIGKLPIEVPKGVTCTFSEGNHKVSVKGPKGELHQVLKPNFKVKVEGNSIEVSRPSEEKPDRALHGLYRALIANMLKGFFSYLLRLSYYCSIRFIERYVVT
jgi:large subunit ribosomal protein L6